MTHLTDGTTTVTPTLIVDNAHAYESQNRTHLLLSGSVAVTLGGTAPRAGTLGLLVHGEEAKQATVDLHRASSVFQLVSPAQPTLAMTYVIAGSGRIAVEQLTRYDDLWMVAIDYQEVIE